MSRAQPTLYWHDYETTGADPRRDRPLQFAGQRTDLALESVGEPTVLYCRPPRDLLPAPGACAVTGIAPSRVESLGVAEADFAAAVLEELAQPGTCGVGYNSIRFDDEVTRHLLWRNLHDPYAREYRNGNSRWDVIDVFRLAHALRPDGLEWPTRDDGAPSFRLEDLAAANGLEHDAHDAAGDVRSTIELVRRLRAAQPRLYDFAFARRDKHSAGDLLRLDALEPILHVSEKYSAHRGCIAPVAALAPHPSNGNALIVADLAADARPLLELDSEAIAAALFKPGREREPDDPDIPLKIVKLNASPVLAPLGTLDADAGRRLGIDTDAARERLRRLRADAGLRARLQAVYERPSVADDDVDTALYSAFVPDADRRQMLAVHRRGSEDLAGFDPGFADARLPELYFRYRARNWPQTLTPAEQERWRALRWERLCRGGAGSPRTLAEFRAELAAERDDGALTPDLADDLQAWADTLMADLPACGEGAND